MLDEIKKIVVIVVIISVVANIYFIKKFFFDKKEIIYVDRPVEVIKYITKVEVVKVPVERPTGEAEALLKDIENATPKIDVEEFIVKRDEQDNFAIPESIKGKMQLAWLKYDLNIGMKAKMLYKKTYDLKAALLVGGCYNNANGSATAGDYTDVAILWSPFKFYDFEANVGAGLKGLALTGSYSLYHNLDVQLGYGWAYLGKSSIIVGLSLRI